MGGPARRSRLRQKQRATVIETILDATEAVADEVGLGGITIAAVAARAGVAVGTLYNYYPDGDRMISALFRARREALTPLIRAAASATKALPFEARLRELVRLLLAAFESEQRFVRIAMQADREGSRCKPRDETMKHETVRALEQVMRDGARHKLFPANRAPMLARALHNALRAMFVWRVSDESIATDGAWIVDRFLHGISER